MKKKQRQVPYYQYIISLICIAIITVGGCYILFTSIFNNYVSRQTENVGDLGEIHDIYHSILENYVGTVDETELSNRASQPP